jgi:hypothetical protein
MGKFITLKIFCFKTGNAHGETVLCVLGIQSVLS